MSELIIIQREELAIMLQNLKRDIVEELAQMAPKPKEKEYLDTKDACNYLGIGKTTFARLIREKGVLPVLVGGKRQFKIQDLDKIRG